MAKFILALLGFIVAAVMWVVEGLFYLVIILFAIWILSTAAGIALDVIIDGFGRGREML